MRLAAVSGAFFRVGGAVGSPRAPGRRPAPHFFEKEPVSRSPRAAGAVGRAGGERARAPGRSSATRGRRGRTRGGPSARCRSRSGRARTDCGSGRRSAANERSTAVCPRSPLRALPDDEGPLPDVRISLGNVRRPLRPTGRRVRQVSGATPRAVRDRRLSCGWPRIRLRARGTRLDEGRAMRPLPLLRAAARILLVLPTPARADPLFGHGQDALEDQFVDGDLDEEDLVAMHLGGHTGAADFHGGSWSASWGSPSSSCRAATTSAASSSSASRSTASPRAPCTDVRPRATPRPAPAATAPASACLPRPPVPRPRRGRRARPGPAGARARLRGGAALRTSGLGMNDASIDDLVSRARTSALAPGDPHARHAPLGRRQQHHDPGDAPTPRTSTTPSAPTSSSSFASPGGSTGCSTPGTRRPSSGSASSGTTRAPALATRTSRSSSPGSAPRSTPREAAAGSREQVEAQPASRRGRRRRSTC